MVTEINPKISDSVDEMSFCQESASYTPGFAGHWFESAKAFINDHLTLTTASEAVSLLDSLAVVASTYGVSRIPVIHPVISEDGSIWLEWILRDRRLGFVVDPDLNESSWFFVRDFGSSSSSGVLEGADLTHIFKAFINDEDL